MAAGGEELVAMDEFDARVRLMLPDQYQDSLNDVQPLSMGSASLKFRSDGTVAWNEIWGSFCDLAMAGGPPHKGRLLEPDTPANTLALPESYQAVTAEICRGIDLVTGLAATPSDYPGWISVDCTSTGQAGWLARAIAMENISVGLDGMVLYVPSGPQYKLEKEIKNVITVMAKTCHYWFGHMSVEQRRSITTLLSDLEARSPLIHPVFPPGVAPMMNEKSFNKLEEKICSATQLCCARDHSGWLGLTLKDVRSAIWLMRALVVGNVLARREEAVVFAAVNPIADPGGSALAARVISAYQLGVARNIFR
jgi:sirohydrochlorin cobaltochelatase